MKGMILAAGRGERMRPLTDHTPKPLLKVGKKPLIVYHIERFKQAGIDDIVINIAHLGDRIIEALGDGRKWGVRITYSDERAEGGLETLGGIVKALPILGNEPFWVINGDVFTDFSIHCNAEIPQSGAYLVLVPNPPHNPQGDFDLFGKKVVDRRRYTFAGIGRYDPDFFKGIEYGKAPLAPLLRRAMREGRVYGELYEGVWTDVGTPERLKALDAALLHGTLRLN
jgi:MurNAc alpha-1-phosphate uridylyltransferase